MGYQEGNTQNFLIFKKNNNVFSELLSVMRRSAKEAEEMKTANKKKGKPANSQVSWFNRRWHKE